ncbi:Uncharacterised protein [Amycolatopsis camponoti]|uniref:Uncharacterized protein n=1 Tax=Amycolatopsis camponoti TaxID=2606593 RepID=A0A6I8MAP5_9PSEU|nr:Uncharacterised protein [Amycolatopsis camponoti]
MDSTTRCVARQGVSGTRRTANRSHLSASTKVWTKYSTGARAAAGTRVCGAADVHDRPPQRHPGR